MTQSMANHSEVPDDCVECRIERLEAKIDMLIEKTDQGVGILQMIWKETKPTIDGLLASPMLKMLMPKGKK